MSAISRLKISIQDSIEVKKKLLLDKNFTLALDKLIDAFLLLKSNPTYLNIKLVLTGDLNSKYGNEIFFQDRNQLITQNMLKSYQYTRISQ